MQQEKLNKSVERNHQERIKYLRENGDDYVTVVNDIELPEYLRK